MTSPTLPEPALIRHLGLADYDSTFAAMRAFTDARTPDTRDELWIVEHRRCSRWAWAPTAATCWPAPRRFPVVQTDRGGEVTYHGPGQVVIYLLMDLRRNKPGGKLYARQFVHKIEQAIINVLRRIISSVSALKARRASIWPAADTKARRLPRSA